MVWYRGRLEQDPDAVPEPVGGDSRASSDATGNGSSGSPLIQEDSESNGRDPRAGVGCREESSAQPDMALVTAPQDIGQRRSLEELSECLDRGVTIRPTRTRSVPSAPNPSASRGRFSFLSRPKTDKPPSNMNSTPDQHISDRNSQMNLPAVVPSRYGPGWVNTASFVPQDFRTQQDTHPLDVRGDPPAE
jgi:hypothetical protein